MARSDQNPNHQADKEKADDVSNPDKISYPRRELPIIAPKLGCPRQSEKQKQIRKNGTRFEKNRVSFHRNPPHYLQDRMAPSCQALLLQD